MSIPCGTADSAFSGVKTFRNKGQNLCCTIQAQFVGVMLLALVALIVTKTLAFRVPNHQCAHSSLRSGDFMDLFDDSLVEVEKLPLEIQGIFPKFVQGAMIRNGPAVFGTVGKKPSSSRRYSHIFDGLAKLSCFEIKHGSLTFSTKFFRSKWHENIISNVGDIPPSITLGPVAPPFNSKQVIEGALTSATRFDNVPVNIHQIGDSTGPWVGVTDAPVMLQFDPLTLDTIGRATPEGSITSFGGVELFSTAHPKSNGNYSFNYFLELRPVALPGLTSSNVAHIVRLDSSLRRHVVGSVELGQGVIPYIHDFSLVGDYAILFVWPVRMDLMKMVNGKGFLSQVDWMGDSGVNTKIFVFDISSQRSLTESKGPIAEFEAPPIFAYHHVNAYREGEGFVVDVTGYSSPGIINGDHGFAYIPNMRDPALRVRQEKDGQCYRYRLPCPGLGLSESNTDNNERVSSSTRARRGATPSGRATFVRPTLLPMVDLQGLAYGGEMARVDDSHSCAGRRHTHSYAFTGFAGREKDRGGFLHWGLVRRDHDAAERLGLELARQQGVAPDLIDVSRFDGSASALALLASLGFEKKPTATVWSETTAYPSEPIFVRDPNRRGGGRDEEGGEEHGVLLSQVYDAVRRETFLLVLDAQSMTELARAYTGVRCPISFHGQFVATASV